MVNVFVWYPSRNGVGHAAMSMRGLKQAYISWWPHKHSPKAALFSTCKMHQSIDEDVAGEDDHQPSSTFLFNSLNEQQIYNCWQKWKQNCTYRIVDRQCCTTVGEMLEAGSGLRGTIAGEVTARELTPISYGKIWSPYSVAVFCRELQAMNF